MFENSSRWISRFHFHTSPSLVLGLTWVRFVGRNIAVVPVLVRNGSFKLKMGLPGVSLRVGTLYVFPSAPTTGMVWAFEVTELYCRLPDLGGIRFRMVKLLKWLMLSNMPPPILKTHFSLGR